jgi:hypothetical protein
MWRARGYVIGVVLIGLPIACGPATTPPASSAPAGTQAQPPPLVMSTAPPPDVPNPSADAPVTAAAWVEPAPMPRGGGDLELHVRARVAPLHYLHSADAEAPFTPTSVELVSSDAVTPAGEWELLSKPDERGHLMDVVDFRRRLRVSDPAKAGRYEVECALKYQACTDELCWPPRVLQLKAPLVLERARD